jgi:FkbH-like protein
VIKANWNHKSENVKGIIEVLNINEKHILFIDDSPSERNEVGLSFPKMKILDIKNPNPLEYIELLNANPFLYNPYVSKTDTTVLYASKPSDGLSTGSVEEYYHSLETQIWIKEIDGLSFDRAHQLTIKTNQFNLNKTIMSQEEFRKYLKDNKGFILEYSDKFVKFDQVGVILLSPTGQIDNIILSCRVFNRDFETVIFTFLKNYAYERGLTLTGVFKPTDANGKFSDIYEKYGFVNGVLKPMGISEYPKWFRMNQKIEAKTVNFVQTEILNILTNEIHKEITISTDLKTVGLNSLTIMIILEKFKKIKNIQQQNLRFETFYDKNYKLETVSGLVDKICKLVN